jgi:hypothetical protein
MGVSGHGAVAFLPEHAALAIETITGKHAHDPDLWFKCNVDFELNSINYHFMCDLFNFIGKNDPQLKQLSFIIHGEKNINEETLYGTYLFISQELKNICYAFSLISDEKLDFAIDQVRSKFDSLEDINSEEIKDHFWKIAREIKKISEQGLEMIGYIF